MTLISFAVKPSTHANDYTYNLTKGLDLGDSPTFVKLYGSATKFSEKDNNGDSLIQT